MASKSSGEAGEPVLVLYGSQTGNAMEIAKTIGADCKKHGLTSKVHAMNDITMAKMSKARVAILVVSSTGDGDPPDNCDRFYSAVRRKSNPTDLLSGLKYTVLGLGDSNYTKFMGVPRAFTTRLTELGAQTFYKPGEADEVDGLEEKVDEWSSGLWAPLKATVLSISAEQPALASDADGPGKGGEARGAASTPAESAPKLAGLSGDSSGDAQVSAVKSAVPWVGEDVILVGLPSLQPCRVEVVWLDGGGGEDATRETSASANGTHNASAEVDGSVTTENVVDGMPLPSHASPFLAPVSDAQLMTAEWSDRRVIHLEVDISGSGIKYQPGDSLGILPMNNSQLVDDLVKRLQVDGNRLFTVREASDSTAAPGVVQSVLSHIKCPCTVRDALLRYVDFTGVAKKGLLRTLAEFTTEEREKKRLLYWSSRGGKDAYKEHIEVGRPSLLDLLRLHPSCAPPLASVLDALPPLVARYYSVTCSPTEYPDKMQVAFSVVRSPTAGGRVFHGVCTNYLEGFLGLAPPGNTDKEEEQAPLAGRSLTLPVFQKSGGDFHSPPTLDASLIMIGPGTGVAPFRGFLQARRSELAKRTEADGESGGAVGEAWLFFGCRREDEDYLYRADLESFLSDGTLTHLELAFSRATDAKVYVQHKIKSNGKALAAILKDPKSYIYVCGDGSRMAKDVHAALVEILVEHEGLREQMATVHLSNMMKQKRYIRDIWS